MAITSNTEGSLRELTLLWSFGSQFTFHVVFVSQKELVELLSITLPIYVAMKT